MYGNCDEASFVRNGEKKRFGNLSTRNRRNSVFYGARSTTVEAPARIYGTVGKLVFHFRLLFQFAARP